jgi:hypothetical protein
MPFLKCKCLSVVNISANLTAEASYICREVYQSLTVNRCTGLPVSPSATVLTDKCICVNGCIRLHFTNGIFL